MDDKTELELQRVANQAKQIYGDQVNNVPVDKATEPPTEGDVNLVIGNYKQEVLPSDPKFAKNVTPIQPKVSARSEFVRNLVGLGYAFDEAETMADTKFGITKDQPAPLETHEEPEYKENKKESANEFTINVTNNEELKFPSAIEEKIIRARSIKLVEVEDVNLKVLNIKRRVPGMSKKSMLSKLNLPMARESFPMPALGDYVTFRGAQIQNIATNSVSDSDSPIDLLDRNTAFIYMHIVGGKTFTKKDENDEVILSVDEFMDLFKYDDIDMALYTIYIASGKNINKTKLKCVHDNCKKEFDYEYNIRRLLDMENVSEQYKKKIDDILLNYQNQEYVIDMVSQAVGCKRVVSPHTGNIYDLASPSIRRARRLFERRAMEMDDQLQFYNIRLMSYIDKIWLGEPGTDEVVCYGFEDDIEESIRTNPDYETEDYDPIGDIMAVMELLPQYEMTFLSTEISKLSYTPEFSINTTCPHCKRLNSLRVDANSMVFLAVQAAMAPIQS